MTNISKVLAIIELGKFLGQADAQNWTKKSNIKYNDIYFEAMQKAIHLSVAKNGWFRIDNVLNSLKSWSVALGEENITRWLNDYHLEGIQPKTVGLVLAGNIPMVGLHDVLCVWLSGHHLKIKPSSQDVHLIPLVMEYLTEVSGKSSKIEWVERLSDFDATIATGSNNSSQYFDYYFAKKPHIIRKNRNSVAVLNGQESSDDIHQLGKDIFTYFGLGCRNVSKIYVPENYNFNHFFESIASYQSMQNFHKYNNNYDYNKAVYMMSQIKIYDNGFLILKEDETFASPIAVLFYETYQDIAEIKNKLTKNQNIQCIVSNHLIENSLNFGKTQEPNLWDYADGIDTLQFLINL